MLKVLRKIKNIVEYIALVMIVIMTIIIAYQVFARFVLNYTPPWIQPLSLLLMVWIGFIGIAVGLQEDSHIKINLFVSMFPKKIQTFIILFQRILAILFGVFMINEGTKFSLSMMNSSIPGLNIPSAILYFSVPFAGLIVIIYLIVEFVFLFKREEVS